MCVAMGGLLASLYDSPCSLPSRDVCILGAGRRGGEGKEGSEPPSSDLNPDNEGPFLFGRRDDSS